MCNDLNVLTHALARDVTLSASLTIYLDVPDCINTLIMNKML